MLFENIGIIDGDFAYKPSCWVGVQGDRIAYLGQEPPKDPERFGERYDGANRLLCPAFFDAHAHAPMTLLRGYAENLPLQTWLFNRVFPFEAKITAEDCYWATLLACAEMARYGVVGFSDMYYHMQEGARAALDSGLKMNLSDTLIAGAGENLFDLPLHTQNVRLLQEWQGAGEGRIVVDCNVHAEYTSHPAAVSQVIAFAAEHGLRMQVHMSETKLEVEECRQRHGGLSPVQYFDSLGMFELPTTAAHCVWVDGEDIGILARKGVFVAANPASNLKLGSGIAPYGAMLEAGVRLCLGTDGMASNNSHDMMQDMYLFALLPKGDAHDPSLITPAQALRAATRTGALSQGRADSGHIVQGAKADLCVLDTSGPSWAPMTDPLVNLVYSGHGSDVCLTMSDGRVVYRDGAWPAIDVERAKAEVSARTARIVAEL